jgi:predicted enzyme related to lactoylglutathione lyase
MVIAFAVDEVDAAYDALTAMGIKFLAPPSDRPEWLARIVHLRDPAGNLIELWAPIATPSCTDKAEHGP